MYREFDVQLRPLFSALLVVLLLFFHLQAFAGSWKHSGYRGNHYANHGYPHSRSYGRGYGYRSSYGSRIHRRGYRRGYRRYGYSRPYGGYGYGYSHFYSPAYRYRNYSYGYRRSYPGVYHLNAPISSYTVYESTDSGNEVTIEYGWQLLASGQSGNALRVFAEKAEQKPTDGAAKFGYSLASAMSGDFERAEWAMRRAFRIDPDAVQGIQKDSRTEEPVTGVLNHYIHQTNNGSRDPDNDFMMAALYCMLDNTRTAREFIDQAISAGDTKISTTNLRQHILNNQPGQPDASHG